MQISATGVTPRSNTVVAGRGFSLVEILVVLIVVVLLIGMVSLNLNSGAGERDIERQLLARKRMVCVDCYVGVR